MRPRCIHSVTGMRLWRLLVVLLCTLVTPRVVNANRVKFLMFTPICNGTEDTCGWPAGGSMDVAAKMMVEQINARGYLRNNSVLDLVVKDTQCSSEAGERETVEMVVNANDWPFGVIGCGCSRCTLTVARMVTTARIPLISHTATTSALSDREEYPNFFRLATSAGKQVEVWFKLFYMLGWKRFAMIYDVDYGQSIIPYATAVRDSYNGEMIDVLANTVAPANMNAATPDVARLLLKFIIETKVRSVMAIQGPKYVRQIVCQMVERKVRGMYVVHFGWYGHGWEREGATAHSCAPAQMDTMTELFVSTTVRFWHEDRSAVSECSPSGVTVGDFMHDYQARRRALGEAEYAEASLAADAICMMAVLYNQMLDSYGEATRLHHMDEATYHDFIARAQAVNFLGLSGPVKFPADALAYGAGDRIIPFVLSQKINGTVEALALSSTNGTSSSHGVDILFMPGKELRFGQNFSMANPPPMSFPECSRDEIFDIVANECRRCGENRTLVQLTGLCECKSGTYERSTDETCIPCHPGRYSDEAGAHQCSSCTPGTYADAQGQSFCRECEDGSYQNSSGSTKCQTCPENTTSHEAAASLEHCRCMKGFFTPTGVDGVACRPCPSGAKCLGKLSLPFAKKKHYAVSVPEGQYLRCTSLMTDNPCLGGSAEMLHSCADGYTGMSCSRCSEGYFRLGKECLSCDGKEGVLKVYYVLLIIVFYLLRRIVNSRLKTLYIFFTFLQIFGLQASFRLSWTTRIKEFMRVLQVANVNIDFLVPFCGPEMSFPYKFVAYLFMPVLFFLVDAALLGIRRLKKATCPRRDTSAQDAPLEIASEGTDDVVMRRSLSKRLTARAENILPMTAINVRLMYIALVGRTLEMLQCTVVEDGPARLSRDPSVACWEGLHARLLPVVVFSLLVYVIGTPLVYTIVLVQGHRKQTLYTPEHIRRWGILYQRFEPEFCFWELCFMLRRVCVVGIKTFLNIRLAYYQQSGYLGNFQAAMTCVVMLGAIMAHFYCRPFNDSLLDFGDANYLACTFVSALIGICFDAARSESEVAALEKLWFVNIGYALLLTLCMLCRDVELIFPKVARRRKWATAAAARAIRSHFRFFHCLAVPDEPVQATLEEEMVPQKGGQRKEADQRVEMGAADLSDGDDDGYAVAKVAHV